MVANKPSIDVIYQWYSSTTNSNTGGTKIAGAANASFPIPTALAVGTYYYFCEVKSGRSAVRSSVARVTVIPAPPPSPVITCPSYVCGSKVTYSVSNLPSGISYSQIVWTCSPNLQPEYGYGYGGAKTFVLTGEGTGWVRARIIQLNNMILDKNNISLNIFPGPTSVSVSTPVNQYVPIIPPDYTYNYDFYCDSEGAGMHFMSAYGPSTQMYISAPGFYTVTAYTMGGCRQSYSLTHTVYITATGSSSSYSATYPNPARDILTVDFDAAVSTQQQPAAASRIAAADYDLRFYDGQGTCCAAPKPKVAPCSST